MANIKISELNPLLTVEDADVLPIVDNAVTKKVTAAILRSYTEGNSVLLTGAQTIAGIKTFTSQLASSVATGTAPFSVASTTKVTNLNADLLDGLSSDAFQGALTLTTTGASGASTLVSNTLNVPNYTLAGLGGVPYTGATTNVNLGTHSLTASDLVINHASGSGVAASISKGGNGEALTVVKSSGSGNAASITGGTTLISELNLTTDLADAYISSAATWNAKQNAITLTTTGTSGAATLVGATLNIPNYGTALASYLPLAGGTLTGNLIGTTAQFNKIGIGNAAAGTSFIFSNVNPTGGTSISAWRGVFSASNDVTSRLNGVNIAVGTQASTTITDIVAYNAEGTSFGAGSSATRVTGFSVDSTLANALATNVYGFQGLLSAGTGRWNLYMTGTAANHLQGNLLIGGTNLPLNRKISIEGNITGAATSYGIDQFVTISSDVTTSMFGYRSNPSTAAAAFTLPDLYHFYANDAGIGAGSAVTRQYGFYSSIASGTGKWGVYIAGTAANYMNGNLLIGTTTDAGFKLDVVGTARISGALTGSSTAQFTKLSLGTSSFSGAVGITNLRLNTSITGAAIFVNHYNDSTIQSDVSTVIMHRAEPSTAASAFTISSIANYQSAFGTKGVGSTITDFVGFLASDYSVSTNTYGFRGNIVSGTNKWNLYMSGTAANYLQGQLLLGTTTTSAFQLDVVGTARVSGAATFGTGISLSNSTAPASGIQFPATQVASASANNLDDYEEGTWTMGFSFGGGTTGITYSANTGTYVKIGRQVTVNGFIQLSSKGSSTGGARITGLPFAIANNSSNYSAPSLNFSAITFANQLQGLGDINQTTIVLEEVSLLGTVTGITDADFANNSYIVISFTYFV